MPGMALSHAVDPRFREDHVKSAQHPRRLVDRPLDLLGLRHVAREEHRGPAPPLDLGDASRASASGWGTATPTLAPSWANYHAAPFPIPLGPP